MSELRERGFAGDFEVDGLLLRCQPCGRRQQPSEATIERFVRVEGPTDPADESIVFGLVCVHCGGRGILVSAYGPAASPEEASVVAGLLGPER